MLTDAYGGTKLPFGAILTVVQNWCHPHGLLLAGEGGVKGVVFTLTLLLLPPDNPAPILSTEWLTPY